MTAGRGDLVVDRLSGAGSPLEVVVLRDARFGADADHGPRPPHRHDYHELVWTRSGTGRHLIDGAPLDVTPGTITVINRGQVHVFERARDLDGAVVRFREEMVGADPATPTSPAWLLGTRTVQSVGVPAGEVDRLEAAIGLLAAETHRPPDPHSVDLQRHLLSAVLLWIDRWHEATRVERTQADDGRLGLYRRFSRLLERDYARHHDPPHYADELGVPQAALSRALVDITGRTTKQLITDRRMLEAARLLRFGDMSVGEVAYRAGYGDQLYFSRAFKRRFGDAPSAYRARSRGRAPDPGPGRARGRGR